MIANIINIIVVGATNFILPKFTSIEIYAAIKEYTLYNVTYANILTAGYIHGVYLKYGGKAIDHNNRVQVGEDYFTFVVFQLIVSSGVFGIGIVSDSVVIKVLGIGLFATNLSSYYQYLYQAVGDFKSYGIALNAARIVSLVFYIILIFLFKTESVVLYLAVPISTEMIIAFFLTARLNRKHRFINSVRINVQNCWANVRGGFVLMLGSFVSRFFTTIDRWFVNALMPTLYFASYSFAVSLENLVNSFMTPLSVSLYNYFCKEYVPAKVRVLKDAISIYACVIVSSAFAAKWILEHFMEQYLNSVAVIFPLFAAQAIGTVVKAIYVNKYKASGQQKKYLSQIVLMVCTSVALNAILYYVLRSMFAIAMATLITNLIWLLLCEIDAPELRYCGKSIVALSLLMCIYLYAGFNLNAIWGFVVYVMSVLAICLLFMRKSTILLVNKGVAYIQQKLPKGKISANM